MLLACRVFGNRAAAGFGWEFLSPPDINEAGHFLETELLLVILLSNVEGLANVASSLIPFFRLESGMLSPILKEVQECSIEISKALLKRGRADVLEPLGLLLTLLLGEVAAQIRV